MVGAIPPGPPRPPVASNAPNPLVQEVVSPVGGVTLTVIRMATTIPIVLIWAVVGLYIWIPLLLQRIGAYVAAVIISAITRDVTEVNRTAINLEHSVSFYTDGFILIGHSIGFSTRHLPEQRILSKQRALEEMGLATLIWFGLFVFYIGYMTIFVW
jgi:hypothetical protein